MLADLLEEAIKPTYDDLDLHEVSMGQMTANAWRAVAKKLIKKNKGKTQDDLHYRAYLRAIENGKPVSVLADLAKKHAGARKARQDLIDEYGKIDDMTKYMEDIDLHEGQYDGESPIGMPSAAGYTKPGGSGVARSGYGSVPDPEGMENSQASAQAAALSQAASVFKGIYRMGAGDKVRVKGEVYTAQTSVQMGPQQNFLTMRGPNGAQFMLVVPQVDATRSKPAEWMTLMQSGRASTKPLDIKVADIYAENIGEEWLDDVLTEAAVHSNVLTTDLMRVFGTKFMMSALDKLGLEAREEGGVSRVRMNAKQAKDFYAMVLAAKMPRPMKLAAAKIARGAIGSLDESMLDESYDPMTWMRSAHGKKDLAFQGGDYVPTRGVLGNRERHRQREEIDKIGENLFKRMYASEREGEKGVWVTYRDNRDRYGHWTDMMKELERAVMRAGYKTQWSAKKDSMVVLYDQRKIKAAEKMHGDYVKWMAKQGSRGAAKMVEAAPGYFEGDGGDNLTEAALPADLAKKHGIRAVVGSKIQPGTLVQNESNVYGIFVSHNPKSGTVNVTWSTGGVFNLRKLKAIREAFDVESTEGGWDALDPISEAVGTDTGPEADAKLKREMEKQAQGAGKVVFAKYRGGGDWQVVFDTEYAALKVFYKWRKDPKVRFGRSTNIGGYYVSRIR